MEYSCKGEILKHMNILLTSKNRDDQFKFEFNVTDMMGKRINKFKTTVLYTMFLPICFVEI